MQRGTRIVLVLLGLAAVVLLVGRPFAPGPAVLIAILVVAGLALNRRYQVGTVWDAGIGLLSRALMRIPPIRGAVSFYRGHRVALRKIGDRAFLGVFIVYTAGAVIWLLAGLLPTLVPPGTSIHQTFHRWGEGSGIWAQIANNAALAAHSAESTVQTTFDYVFSALNLGLGIFLVIRGPKQRAARLLAVGMIGTAVAFNFQGHDARQMAPLAWTTGVEIWHTLVHVLSGVTYLFALLLFPDGHFAARRRVPYLVLLTILFAGFSLIAATSDHTISLVLLFGIATPIAALSSQFRRFRRAPTPEQRQQSKLLLVAVAVAFGGAALLAGLTTLLSTTNEAFSQTTRDYTFTAPPPGTYYFVCDPHPRTMQGTVQVFPSSEFRNEGTFVTRIEAEGSRFDRGLMRLPAGQETVIRFTNRDGDLHNVAIYRTPTFENPVFDGAEFSGGDLARLTFQIFRGVFLVLPIALFVGILRFRLWDIDRLINRAMVYGIVTAILGLVYFGGILLFQLLLSPFIAGSEVAITASTVAAGALFRPARARVQRFIDRRFYRAKYDAVQTLEAFTARLREEVDLDSVTSDLVEVVRETMQSAHVSLWLRPAADMTSGPGPKPEGVHLSGDFRNDFETVGR
jgi:plastocyanin